MPPIVDYILCGAILFGKGLLFSLIDIYESLRMCGEDGYIARQLAFKYEMVSEPSTLQPL